MRKGLGSGFELGGEAQVTLACMQGASPTRRGPPDQGAEFFCGRSVDSFPVVEHRRRGLDPELVSKRDILLDLARRQRSTDAFFELPAINVRRILPLSDELLQVIPGNFGLVCKKKTCRVRKAASL